MTDAEIPAPFVSSLMRVEPPWIDYNGHLNVAYYNVLFDRAVDELYELLGLGPDYLKQHKHSTMVAEMHVRYLREVDESAPLKVSVQLLDFDAKRMHLFEQLLHAERRLGFRHLGEHDAARRHDGQESGAVPRRRHARAGAHERRARAPAAARGRRPPRGDAGEALTVPIRNSAPLIPAKRESSSLRINASGRAALRPRLRGDERMVQGEPDYFALQSLA